MKSIVLLAAYRFQPNVASWRMFWQSLTTEQKLTIKRMPHFDADVFYEITGIRLGKLHRLEQYGVERADKGIFIK